MGQAFLISDPDLLTQHQMVIIMTIELLDKNQQIQGAIHADR